MATNNDVIDVLEVGRLYRVGLEYPPCLKHSSPSRQIPIHGDWHTATADASTMSPRRIHRNVALVIGLNVTSGVDVLLLSTSLPQQPHRYLPWEGTARLPGQPPHHVISDPRHAHNSIPGYLNFTHAISVTILNVNDASGAWRGVVPGVCCFKDIRAARVSIPPGEIDTIKEIHSQYWAGVRFNSYGEEEGGAGCDGEGKGGSSNDDRTGGGGDASHIDITKLFAEKQVTTRLASCLSSKGTVVVADDVLDPVEPESGKRISMIMKEVLEQDEIRNAQLDMIKEGYDRGSYDSPLLKGHFYPLDEETLQCFKRGELDVDLRFLC